MGELVCVENLSKKIKSNIKLPTSPIKTTNCYANFVSKQEQQKYSPLSKNNGVTAIVAVIKAGPRLNCLDRPRQTQNKISKAKSSNKKVPKDIVRILLDSGSDGDLMFHEKGTKKCFPYLARQTPKSWCTSNGVFLTKGKTSLEVKFFEYSNSKSVFLTPEIVEYDRKNLGKPAFNIIIGTKTMNDLGIILDFKSKIVTVDDIELPMRSIERLPTSNKKALNFNNSVARNIEPKSTEFATQRIVTILDAKYEKANLPEIVNNNCTHLSTKEQNYY